MFQAQHIFFLHLEQYWEQNAKIIVIKLNHFP